MALTTWVFREAETCQQIEGQSKLKSVLVRPTDDWVGVRGKMKLGAHQIHSLIAFGDSGGRKSRVHIRVQTTRAMFRCGKT